MITFLIIRGLGWAKGKSLTEAIKNYRRYNEVLRGKYQLCILDTPTQEDFDQVRANEWEYIYSKNTKLLYKGVETR